MDTLLFDTDTMTLEKPPALGGFELRDYQRKAVDDLMAVFDGGARSAIYQGVTGSGKTAIGGEFARLCQLTGARIYWATHRIELSRQSGQRLVVDHGVSATVMSPVALRNRIRDRRIVPKRGDVLVVDEAHHALAKTWRYIILAFRRAGARVLGLTATPWRLGINDCFVCLRTHPPVPLLDDVVDDCQRGGGFDALVTGPTKMELIASGALSPLRVELGPMARQIAAQLAGQMNGRDFTEAETTRAMGRGNAPMPVLIKSAVEWLKLNGGNGRRTIIYVVSIGHGERIAAALQAVGIRARMVSAKTPADEREEIFAEFAEGKISALVNVAIATEGVDVPEADTVMLLRATKSLALYLQMVGRAERVAPGKLMGLIYDPLGMSILHDDPAAERAWSLERRLDRGIGNPITAYCVADCGAGLPTRMSYCRNCRAPQWAVCRECGVASRLKAPLEDYQPGTKPTTPDCERCEARVAIRARREALERAQREEHAARRAAQRADDLTRRIEQRHNSLTRVGWENGYTRKWVLLRMYGVVGECEPEDRETAIRALAKLVPLPKSWADARCEGLRQARNGSELTPGDVERALISMDSNR